MPDRLAMTDRKVKHETGVVAAVPVRRARVAPHRVAHVDPPRLATLVTYPARARQHAQHLAVLVRVPVRTGAGREHDVVDVDDWAGVGVDGTKCMECEQDCACDCERCSLDGRGKPRSIELLSEGMEGGEEGCCLLHPHCASEGVARLSARGRRVAGGWYYRRGHVEADSTLSFSRRSGLPGTFDTRSIKVSTNCLHS